MRATLFRLVADESGQDMVEYALLTAFFGLAGWAAIQGLEAIIGPTYQAVNTQNNDLWETPNPLP